MAQNRKTRKKRPSAKKRAPRRATNRRARTSRKSSRTIKASLQDSAASPGLFSFPDSIPVTWLKFAIGLVLFPLCWITTEATLTSVARVTVHAQFWRSPEFFFFAVGALMWVIVFFGARHHKRVLFSYVLGHEWTHAFFALLCGARVERVQVHHSGGHILTDKNNVLISLSPYLVPFYTVVLMGLYAVANHFVVFEEIHNRVLFALIGVTWTYHLSFTVWMILKNQPDLRQNGTFFSVTLIYLVNLTLIITMFVAASPQLTWREFATTWLSHAYTFGPRLVASVRELLQQIL